jgi:hypothetical protein
MTVWSVTSSVTDDAPRMARTADDDDVSPVGDACFSNAANRHGVSPMSGSDDHSRR